MGETPAFQSRIIIHRPKSEDIELSSDKTGLFVKETRYYGNSAVDFIQKQWNS
jgi:hypothetical protein